jgi:hypothetical protein
MKKFELFPMNLQYFAEGEGEGETAPEAAAPVEETAASEEPTGEAVEESTEPQFDTDKQNAAFAQMRRRMEAAERKAAEIDAIYAKQFEGYTNPETGAPIRSARDYADALAAQQRLQAREKLEQANVDPDLIDNLIANSPVLRQAEEAMAELNQIRTEKAIEEDIKEVLKLDASLTSREDLFKDPSFAKVLERVQSGMNLVDAYKLENFERLTGSKTAAAKQAVINQVKGQSHLTNGTAITSTDSLEDIPPNMLEMYKEAFPDKSMKDLKALYNQSISNRR